MNLVINILVLVVLGVVIFFSFLKVGNFIYSLGTPDEVIETPCTVAYNEKSLYKDEAIRAEFGKGKYDEVRSVSVRTFGVDSVTYIVKTVEYESGKVQSDTTKVNIDYPTWERK